MNVSIERAKNDERDMRDVHVRVRLFTFCQNMITQRKMKHEMNALAHVQPRYSWCCCRRLLRNIVSKINLQIYCRWNCTACAHSDEWKTNGITLFRHQFYQQKWIYIFFYMKCVMCTGIYVQIVNVIIHIMLGAPYARRTWAISSY